MEVTKTLLPSKAAWYLEAGDYDAYAVDQGGEFLLCRDAKGLRPHAAAEMAEMATGTLREVMQQFIDWIADGAYPRYPSLIKQPLYVRHRVDKLAAISGFPRGRAIAFASQEEAAAAIIYHELDPTSVEIVDVEPDSDTWPLRDGLPNWTHRKNKELVDA